MLMCDATGLSQRRACRLTGLSLSTCRYEAHRPAADAHLSGRITELALERRRFGYRRIWQLLRREGLHVRSEERFSRNAETDIVCRLLLEKKNVQGTSVTTRSTAP